MTYKEWIDLWVDEPACLCAEYSYAMIRCFPELRRISGHLLCPKGRTYEHWWCRTPEGEVVDPTAGQYMTKWLSQCTYVPVFKKNGDDGGWEESNQQLEDFYFQRKLEIEGEIQEFPQCLINVRAIRALELYKEDPEVTGGCNEAK